MPASPALPPRPDRALPLTRGHLFALAAVSVSMSVLSLFIGVSLGRREAPAVAFPEHAPLVGEDVRSGNLEVLLTRVEQRDAALGLAFPTELPRSALPSSSDGVPRSGYAIEVATRPDEADAQRIVETLRAAGLPAYRLAALVDGVREQRVRIGGFASEDVAGAALSEVSARAGVANAKVVAAP